MKRQVVLDTGPLVAFLNSRDTYHDWSKAQWGQIQPPLFTCEAVISEACFLLRRLPKGAGSVIELIERQVLDISFCLADHAGFVSGLMKNYGNVPMSLADACLVRMAELYDGSSIITLDADFRIYRKHKRHIIPLLMPPDLA